MLKFARRFVGQATVLMALAVPPVQATDWPGLPPSQQVVEALARQPRVLEAQALREAATAKAASLKTGAYEWTLRAGLQNRAVKNGADSREWETALERAIRLPAKSRLDDSLGQSLVQQSEFAVGDAMHEAAKELLDNWFEFARARESARVWEAQTEVLRKQLEIVEKRIRAGDAPRLEREAARAALHQAQSQAARAVMLRDTALSLLKARYPQLVPSPVDMPDPPEPEGTPESVATAMLEDNHELAYHEAAAQAARLNAQRLAANHVPDPALGVRYSSEQGGNEKVLGTYVSIALPGAARRHDGEVALAESQAAGVRAAAVRARLVQEAEARYWEARHRREAWLKAKESLLAFQRQADGAARAYQLGEGSLSESLTARRLALEAQMDEIGARADALLSVYRLKLDGHQLWPFHTPE